MILHMHLHGLKIYIGTTGGHSCKRLFHTALLNGDIVNTTYVTCMLSSLCPDG